MIRSTNAHFQRRFLLYDVPVTNIKVVCATGNIGRQQRISASTKLSAGFYQNKR
jgi:hypothetical protein